MDPGVAEALTALEVAQNHLDQAQGPDMIEAACYEVSAAELRLRAAIRRAKAERSEVIGQVATSGKGVYESQGAVPRVWPHGSRQGGYQEREVGYPLPVRAGYTPGPADERI